MSTILEPGQIEASAVMPPFLHLPPANLFELRAARLEQLAEGKTKLAIFYGAGHMPEMRKQLEEDFELKRGGRFWLPAWNLKQR